MEGPVLTTPSSHRLRSAVSACAQPPHSYFGSSSYLGARIQCSTHNSGGCIKKFYRFSRKGESPVFDKLNLTQKNGASGGSNGISKNGYGSAILGAKSGLNRHFGFKSPFRFQSSQSEAKNHHCGHTRHRRRRNGKANTLTDAVTEPSKALSAPLTLGKDFFSKLTFNRSETETKKLLDYLSYGLAIEINRRYEKVVNGDCKSKSCNNQCLDNGSDYCNCSRYGSVKILNYYTKNLNKVKTKCSINKVKGIGGSSGGGGGERVNVNSGGVVWLNKNVEVSAEKICDRSYHHNVQDTISDYVKFRRIEIFKWQPNQVLTRRTAHFIRETCSVWQKRFGALKSVPAKNIQLLFNDLGLSPSVFKVAEMLKCAQECSKNPSTKHLTFGEFYKIANDLIRTDCRIASTTPTPKVFEKNVEKFRGTFSKGMNRYEVFLGGSCNPTTWRTDLAIPELERMNITYYNPQVEEWRPELLEAEHQAKENATILFFVIDNQTRGVSALIEVAHLAGNQRKLILVIQSYRKENQIISDEEISQKEYEDLKMGQEVLRDLVERQGIPVFDDIKVALKSTEKILREGLTVQDLKDDENRVGRNENVMYPRDIFDILDGDKTGKIFFWEMVLALKLLCRRNISLKRLIAVAKASENNSNGVQFENAKIDFNTFMKLIDQFDIQRHRWQRQQQQQVDETKGDSEEKKAKEYSITYIPVNRCESICDIYLGGTLENTDWRQTIAIPLLNSENLRYFTPRTDCVRDSKLMDVEVAAMESIFVLLFVITNTSRSIAAMAIAGHYIGRGANVVLCVQQLPKEAQFDGETLTDRAVKDYNRGRMYLMDIAKRSGIVVFDRITDAVACAIEKCKSTSASEKDKNSKSQFNVEDEE